jgi:hypothetical protein
MVAVDTFDVSNNVTRYWAFNGLIGSAALLLPMAAVPESRVEAGAANAASQATAHVNFRIIIPKVLYLQVGGTKDPDATADTVAIMSNSRNVWLTATVRSSDGADHSGPTHSAARPPASHGNVILSAAGRKIIAQDTVCSAGEPHAAAMGVSQVICTVSMP